MGTVGFFRVCVPWASARAVGLPLRMLSWLGDVGGTVPVCGVRCHVHISSPGAARQGETFLCTFVEDERERVCWV